MVKRRDCFIPLRMSTLKLLTYAYACQSPLTPTRKTCSLVLTGTKSFEAQASIVPIQPNRSGVF